MIVRVEVVLNSTVVFDSDTLVNLCTKRTVSLRILLTITSFFS